MCACRAACTRQPRDYHLKFQVKIVFVIDMSLLYMNILMLNLLIFIDGPAARRPLRVDPTFMVKTVFFIDLDSPFMYVLKPPPEVDVWVEPPVEPPVEVPTLKVKVVSFMSILLLYMRMTMLHVFLPLHEF